MEKEPPVYSVAKLFDSIAIDADWDKPAWQAIQPLLINNHMGAEPSHRPKVLAKLAWDETALYVIFRVEDRYVRAVAQTYQDPVCLDSCAELFFTPAPALSDFYFNIEINCGGTMLFEWHPNATESIPVAATDADRVTIAHTLPKRVDPEIKDPTTWTIEYRLPFTVLRKYCPAAVLPAKDVTWRANLYKCADKTSHPHWLTWTIVDFPRPNFHPPCYFGALKFDEQPGERELRLR